MRCMAKLSLRPTICDWDRHAQRLSGIRPIGFSDERGEGRPTVQNADPQIPPRSTMEVRGELVSGSDLRLAGGPRHSLLATERLVAMEPGIGVPQGNIPDRDRTNTKPWARVSQHRGRNHSHSHSHCSMEPLLALPRVVQGQDRDLLPVQLPSRHRDHHDANHHHASRRRSDYHHRRASHRHHYHVHCHAGQRMTEQPKMPVTQAPPSWLLNV